MRSQIRDVDIRRMAGVNGEMSLRSAWVTMRDQEIDTLCVVDEEQNLKGVITVKDVATANMDVLDTYILAEAKTSYQNIIDTLGATVVVGDVEGKRVEGSIIIGSGSPEQMEKAISKGDIVIVGNRIESQPDRPGDGRGLSGGVHGQQDLPYHLHAGRGEGLYHPQHHQQHLCGRTDDPSGRPHPPLHGAEEPALLQPEHLGGGGHQAHGLCAFPLLPHSG